MSAETTIAFFQTLGVMLIYAIVGTGPGLIVGIWIGNFLGARGQGTLIQKHYDAMRRGHEHNAQWHPNDPRWKK